MKDDPESVLHRSHLPLDCTYDILAVNKTHNFTQIQTECELTGLSPVWINVWTRHNKQKLPRGVRWADMVALSIGCSGALPTSTGSEM